MIGIKSSSRKLGLPMYAFSTYFIISSFSKTSIVSFYDSTCITKRSTFKISHETVQQTILISGQLSDCEKMCQTVIELPIQVPIYCTVRAFDKAGRMQGLLTCYYLKRLHVIYIYRYIINTFSQLISKQLNIKYKIAKRL